MRARLVMAVVLSALALAACGQGSLPGVRLETEGAPLTAAGAERLAASTDIRAFASVETSRAPALRASALQELRASGEAGTRAAELLTAGFPEQTASVPVLVRFCQIDGVDAVVVVEAYGDAGGMITHRRLWVFDRNSGALLRAASFY
jgi:hypothetical protein